MNTPAHTVTAGSNDRTFFIVNAVVSAAALGFLAWLLILNPGQSSPSNRLEHMPAVNALFNATSAALLTLGYVAIRRRRIRAHQQLMTSAFISSTLFLVGYVAYHYVHGDTKYAGTGAMRLVYFAILISHILLSTAIVPMALSAFYFAWKQRFVTHRKVTRILLPIWLYVSVTGVIIFFMLRR